MAPSLRLDDAAAWPGREFGAVTRWLQRRGAFHGRNMYWWWGARRNFGDWIGPLLFRWRTGQRPVYCKPSVAGARRVFFTVGSILTHIRQPDVAVVWGSGMTDDRTAFPPPRETRAVRGPLSRRRMLDLGYPCPEVFGDPAILLPQVVPPPPGPPQRRLGVVTHFDHRGAADHLAGDPRVRIIDPLWPVERVVAAIADCEAVVSSSLHGVIVAHAYGVPAAQVAFAGEIAGGTWKFADYFLSVGVDDPPVAPTVTPTTTVEDLLAHVARAPRVDVSRLRQPLIDACPF